MKSFMTPVGNGKSILRTLFLLLSLLFNSHYTRARDEGRDKEARAPLRQGIIIGLFGSLLI